MKHTKAKRRAARHRWLARTTPWWTEERLAEARRTAAGWACLSDLLTEHGARCFVL